MNTSDIVEFNSISKQYKNQRAADDLNLKFKSGSTIGLLGVNGAGKTTFLKMLMGILSPTSGSVSVFGEDILCHGPKLRQNIGYVPDDPWLYPWMTVSQIVRFSSAMYNRWDTTLSDDLLDKFALPRDRRIKDLSRGMRVKAALLVALSHRPRLLVLDEPLSGLDPLARDELIEILVAIKNGDTECIVLSSHQIDDVNRVADEVAIVDAGKLIVHSPIDSLIRSTKRVEAVLLDGRLPEHTLPQTIWQRIDRREWSMTLYPYDSTLVETLRKSNPISSTIVQDIGLEQIFKDFILGRVIPC